MYLVGYVTHEKLQLCEVSGATPCRVSDNVTDLQVFVSFAGLLVLNSCQWSLYLLCHYLLHTGTEWSDWIRPLQTAGMEG